MIAPRVKAGLTGSKATSLSVSDRVAPKPQLFHGLTLTATKATPPVQGLTRTIIYKNVRSSFQGQTSTMATSLKGLKVTKAFTRTYSLSPHLSLKSTDWNQQHFLYWD